MIFVATSAAWLTMNHRDESNYKGAAPAHPEEAATHGLNVSVTSPTSPSARSGVPEAGQR